MAGPNPSLEMVSCDSVFASPAQVLFRDPKTFKAREIHPHLPQWDWVLEDYPKRQEIFDYISHGVKVSDFFVHFKGDFRGNSTTFLLLRLQSSLISRFASNLKTFLVQPFCTNKVQNF